VKFFKGETMKNICFLVAVFFTLCGLAQASDKGGFFLEPSLTLEKGESEINFPSPLNSSKGDIDGFGAGLRLGFHVHESLFLGVDGRYAVPTFKDSAIDQDVKATTYNIGPVVGFQMPTLLGLRFWGTYILGSELDPEKDNGFDEKFTDGNGYRLGGGIKLGVVSLNLEYQTIIYEDTEIESAGPFSGNFNNTELKNNSWILSVSFPVSL